MRFRVSVRSSERAEVKERAGPASPYVEQNCADAKRTSASGGLVFTRIPGGRVRVQWAFPDARMRGCPGPTRAARRLRPKMVRVVPGNRFQASRVTLKLSGVARFAEGRYAGVYRWRAVVTLARA